MSHPKYTVFVRVPIPRGDFVDPPPVHWDSTKDEALWRILSGAAQTEIDWSKVAERFDVPVDFLLQQVAYLTERHASQVRAQVRKATAAAKGSSAPSPVPGMESTLPAQSRTTSALSGRRDSPMPRHDGSTTATPLGIAIRPNMSRDTSANTAILKDGNASPRPGSSLPTRSTDPVGRKRLSSLPIASPTVKSPEPQVGRPRDETASPGPAESSSNESSEDESSPAQSRIIRRPPRFQIQQDASETYQDDGDDESEPAFGQYQPSSDQAGQDMTSTLKGEGQVSDTRSHKATMRNFYNQSQTSDDSSTGSPVGTQQPKSRDSKIPGPLSPRRTAELAGRSPSGRVKASSHEGSEGTPSMGSSFSDLDDASVTQSALEEALASHMGGGASSRFSISQAFRSRYNPGSGYFINEDDEIRSIENPRCYFKFYIDRNPRVNQRQRFAFDYALEKIVHERLEHEGLQKKQLALGSSSDSPNVPIFVSPNLLSASRVVTIFGEPSQNLGILAGRVANGPGGINKGSMVSVVQEIQRQASSATDPFPPGIVMANTGQLFWWPEEHRSVTVTDSAALPLPSLVHAGRRYIPELNSIPGNETPGDHVASVFGEILRPIENEDVKISLVAIGQSCELVMQFLDNEENWKRWERNMDAMVLLGTVYPVENLTNTALIDFLAKRTRGYINSSEPLDTPLLSPAGSPSEGEAALGCPCYSSASPFYIETILIDALKPALRFLQNLASTPGYENEIMVAERPKQELDNEDWLRVPEEERPAMASMESSTMKESVRTVKQWRKFIENARDPNKASSEDDKE